MQKEELLKLNSFFKKLFHDTNISIKARFNKEDSAEVYRGEEFLGVIYRDEEDGELSYNFSMAILDVDLV